MIADAPQDRPRQEAEDLMKNSIIALVERQDIHRGQGLMKFMIQQLFADLVRDRGFEQNTGKGQTLIELFDLICGTNTGGTDFNTRHKSILGCILKIINFL